MFTVLILSESARSSLERWRGLFDPFVRAGSIAFCDWNTGSSARNLGKAVPRLQETVLGQRAWRAIAVDIAPPAGRSSRHATVPDNPFDYLGNAPTGEGERPREQLNLEESPHPFVRLSHMLLGYPGIGTKAFEADPSYRDRDSARRVHESEILGRAGEDAAERESAAAEFRASLVRQRDVQVHFREIDYSEAERSRHAELSDLYRLRHLRPSEAVLISTRHPRRESQTEDLRIAWQQGTDAAANGASRFVERNDYPPSCRFSVYDLLQPGDAGAELDELKMWLAVLTMASNDLPPSSFQAERVYRLGLELDEPALGGLLNEHLGRLTAVREHLDRVIRQPVRSNDKPLAEILSPRTVKITFDALRGDELSVPTAGYSLAADVPRSDGARWDASVSELRQRAETFVRGPRRVLARAVEDTRAASRAYLGEEQVALTEIERDELRDELAKRTHRLTDPTTPDILDRERLQRIIDSHSTEIRQAMARRMRMPTILIASSVAAAAWLGALLPYLLKEMTLGATAIAESLLVVLVIFGFVGGVGLLVLVYLRWRLISLLRAMNGDLKGFVIGVNSGAHAFASYLGDLATYMYGRSVLIAASRGDERHRARVARLAAMRKQVITRIDNEKAIVQILGTPLQVQRTEDGLLAADLESPETVRAVFEWPQGRRSAALNQSGDVVASPYDFIRQLVIERILVREPTAARVREVGDPR